MSLDDTDRGDTWDRYLHDDVRSDLWYDDQAKKRISVKIMDLNRGLRSYRNTEQQVFHNPYSEQSQQKKAARDADVQQNAMLRLFDSHMSPDDLTVDPLPQYFNGIAFDGGIGEWCNESGMGCTFGNVHICKEEPCIASTACARTSNAEICTMPHIVQSTWNTYSATT